MCQPADAIERSDSPSTARAKALSRLSAKDRKLLALVYDEDRSVREAGRLLSWGKSSADRHHTEAMKKLLALVGDRALLSPALIGLVAQAMVLSDRKHRVGGLVNLISAWIQDVLDFIEAFLSSALHSVSEAARRVAPFTDASGVTGSGGAGRTLAQCGAAAAVAVCGVLAVSPIKRGVDLLVHDHPATEPRSARIIRPKSEPSTGEQAPEATVPPSAILASPSHAQRVGELRAKRRRENAKRRVRARRRAKLGRSRRAKASSGHHSNEAEPPETEASEVEVAPEEASPVPESEAPSAQPPAATGGQVRGEFGL